MAENTREIILDTLLTLERGEEFSNKLIKAVLDKYGAVSAPVAGAMASGVRNLLKSDVAVSVTGLAGPGGDDFGNPVGTICIGYADRRQTLAKQYRFYGDRDDIRQQSIRAALELVLEMSE